MASSDNERSLRHIWLLGEGGLTVLRGIVDREALSRSQTLDLILENNRFRFNRNTEQYFRLFPSDSTVNADIRTWDISLLVLVVTKLFWAVLSPLERNAIRSLKSFRDEVEGDTTGMSMMEREYATSRADITTALRQIASGLDQRTIGTITGIINRSGSADIDMQASIQHVRELDEFRISMLDTLDRRFEFPTGMGNTQNSIQDDARFHHKRTHHDGSDGSKQDMKYHGNKSSSSEKGFSVVQATPDSSEDQNLSTASLTGKEHEAAESGSITKACDSVQRNQCRESTKHHQRHEVVAVGELERNRGEINTTVNTLADTPCLPGMEPGVAGASENNRREINTTFCTPDEFDSLQSNETRDLTTHHQGPEIAAVGDSENNRGEITATTNASEQQERRLRTHSQELELAAVTESDNENAHYYTRQQMYRHLELTRRANGSHMALQHRSDTKENAEAAYTDLLELTTGGDRSHMAMQASVQYTPEIRELIRSMIVLTQLGGNRQDVRRDTVLRMKVESDSPSQVDDADFALCMLINHILIEINPTEVFTNTDANNPAVANGNEQPEGAVALQYGDNGEDISTCESRESIDSITQRILSKLPDTIKCHPELVKLCLELIHDLLKFGGVVFAGKGCVMLMIKCKSFEGVLRLLQYCNSERFQQLLRNISSTLEIQTGRAAALTAQVTQESLKALAVSIDEEFKNVPKERALLLETKYAGDVDLYRIRHYLESDRAKEKCQQLAGALSRLVGGRIALTISMDLKDLKKALESPSDGLLYSMKDWDPTRIPRVAPVMMKVPA